MFGMATSGMVKSVVAVGCGAVSAIAGVAGAIATASISPDDFEKKQELPEGEMLYEDLSEDLTENLSEDL